jgi:hypothetical protein
LDGCLVAGWAIMLGGFYLVAGPQSIAPHYERYGLCLIAPAIVLLGRGFVAWLGGSHALRPQAATALIVLPG